KWIEAFRASAPDNPLADFYAAKQAFDSKNPEAALAFIAGGATKEGFSDYAKEIGSTVESMLLSAGNGDVESKAMTVFGISTVENLGMEKSLARELAAYRITLLESGDTGAAYNAAEAGVALAGILTERQMAGSVIGQLLGMSMESIAIKGLDDATAVSLTGQTSAERQQEFAAQKQEIKELINAVETLLDSSDRQTVLQYLQIWEASGEIAAAQWWKARNSTPAR
ncbi:MAG TPA: hypothetical protein VK968_15315, partial [Roseimicrobium sp.]|nr:hypothetical protein [Roseimicrobium sp.]